MMNMIDYGNKLQYFAKITANMLEDFRNINKGKRVKIVNVDSEYKFEGCYLSRDGSLTIMYRDINTMSSHESALKYIEKIGD